ncbi:MAG: hypothetical protein P1V51_13880 [Deltaproteobacteria bacterium]|nr:hypothetical protein [Deltaproteobacteria bacterium]
MALWEAMNALHGRVRVEHLVELHRLREAALDRLGAGTTDERRLDSLCFLAQEYARRKLPDETLAVVEELLALTPTEPWTRWRIDAIRSRSAIRLLQGRVAEAREDGELALGALETLDDRLRLARVLTSIAGIDSRTGDPIGAERKIRHAMALFELEGEDGSDEYTSAVRDLAVALLRQQRLDEAEVLYQEAFVLLDGLGNPDAFVARLNLALIEVDRGRYAEGAEEAWACVEAFRAQGRPPFAGLALAVILPHAATGEPEAFKALCAEAGRIYRDTQWWDLHAADLLTLAASLASDPEAVACAEHLAEEIRAGIRRA